MAGPGAVAYNFENKGLLLIQKESDTQDQMLKLIDLGVEDIEETTDGLEVYTPPEKLKEIRNSLEKAGFKVISAELYMRPKNFQETTDPTEAKKILSFLESLDDHDDVQNVFSNVDIPDNLVV